MITNRNNIKVIKYIFSIFLFAVFCSEIQCQGTKIIKRKDKVQYVRFNKKISSEKVNFINLYQLEYPTSSDDKDKFIKDLEILSSRLILSKRNVNLILPYSVIKDLDNIKNEQVFKEEELYSKPASELTSNEKAMIDSAIDVEYPYDLGDIQGYLNKQMYYWLKYTGKAYEYDKDAYYTELDKSDIVSNIIQDRQKKIRSLSLITSSFVVEVTDKEKDHIKDINYPIYISQKLAEEIGLNNIRSKVVIYKIGDTPYEITTNKIILADGAYVTNIKDHVFYTAVINEKNIITLLRDATDNEITVSDLNSGVIQIQKEKEEREATVRVNDAPRSTIIPREAPSPWRVSK